MFCTNFHLCCKEILLIFNQMGPRSSKFMAHSNADLGNVVIVVPACLKLTWLSFLIVNAAETKFTCRVQELSKDVKSLFIKKFFFSLWWKVEERVKLQIHSLWSLNDISTEVLYHQNKNAQRDAAQHGAENLNLKVTFASHFLHHSGTKSQRQEHNISLTLCQPKAQSAFSPPPTSSLCSPCQTLSPQISY